MQEPTWCWRTSGGAALEDMYKRPANRLNERICRAAIQNLLPASILASKASLRSRFRHWCQFFVLGLDIAGPLPNLFRLLVLASPNLLTGRMTLEVPFRFSMTSVLRDQSLTNPCSLRKGYKHYKKGSQSTSLTRAAKFE